jgi:DHA2 family multidrug resistance protein
MLLLAALSVACLGGLIYRSLRRPMPLIDLSAFRDRNFAAGCWFSFVLGMGLYGATYLLPVFLGLVRNYDAFTIGGIMMVTGAAQLVMAPIATALERRADTRLLTTVGYALLAIGFIGNGFMTFQTDFWGLFWQQIMRGAAVMLCLLPTTSAHPHPCRGHRRAASGRGSDGGASRRIADRALHRRTYRRSRRGDARPR